MRKMCFDCFDPIDSLFRITTCPDRTKSNGYHGICNHLLENGTWSNCRCGRVAYSKLYKLFLKEIKEDHTAIKDWDDKLHKSLEDIEKGRTVPLEGVKGEIAFPPRRYHPGHDVSEFYKE